MEVRSGNVDLGNPSITAHAQVKSPNTQMQTNSATPADLLGALSRDIRIPLNSILGFANLLKDQNVNEADREQFLNRILFNGDQLLQILDDAFKISKVIKGETSQETISFNVSEMIYDLCKNMKAVAEKKDLGIHLIFKTAIPQTVQSDPVKLRQVLTHLLGSAIREARSEGFVILTLSYGEPDETEELGSAEVFAKPRIDVAIDTSAPAPSAGRHTTRESNWNRLESAFNETSAITLPGFILSQKFAESIGGNLSAVPSRHGDGTRFLFSFPTGDLTGVTFLKSRKSPSIVDRIARNFNKANRLKGLKILLAEDSEDNVVVISMHLANEGAKVTPVRNGLEAIEAVKTGQYDLVLMDIQMPLLDGLETTRQLRNQGFKKPIIALTAHALRDDAEKSLKAGCDTHITKPINQELLIEEIRARVPQKSESAHKK